MRTRSSPGILTRNYQTLFQQIETFNDIDVSRLEAKLHELGFV